MFVNPFIDAIGSWFSGIGSSFAGFSWVYVFQLVHDLFILLDVVLIAIIVFVLIELRQFRPAFSADPRKDLGGKGKKLFTLRDEGILRRWEALKIKAEVAPPQSLTLAIIEADSLVDSVLKRTGLPGEHMADRLDQLDSSDVRTLDRLWRAHRARNELVHTPGYYLSPTDARRFLEDYEAFLKELEVI